MSNEWSDVRAAFARIPDELDAYTDGWRDCSAVAWWASWSLMWAAIGWAHVATSARIACALWRHSGVIAPEPEDPQICARCGETVEPEQHLVLYEGGIAFHGECADAPVAGEG